ncbi:ankyrin repeat and ELMO domain-containing protein D-like [Vigna radiata var. radiata]|uniref:Ankyrin repeat and ELMO domain-containing protein D-like n=1 Tax=Vigna radiata var. radiata TaxID=3916 RepID=A0A1S3VBH0_VIGRR|nr:ankyrin repeat and ELMO domain-containing protein D-like [Vigna radiata var. radiata]
MDAWEGLEIDDDVLQCFLKKCDSSSSLIPGPAGNVQATMMNRISDDPRTTQQFVEDVAKATYEREFNTNAWKWAEMYIKHHDIVKDGDINNANHLHIAKSVSTLHLVVCIVKECHPNGLGDMKLSLKDPSGTMKASLHHKVLKDPSFGPYIGLGCVMILNNVRTFSAFPTNCYVNIVLRNVIKVFGADICPPTKELVMETPKPVIRPLDLQEPNMAEIMRKLRYPHHLKPSTSKVPDNNNGENSNPDNNNGENSNPDNNNGENSNPDNNNGENSNPV